MGRSGRTGLVTVATLVESVSAGVGAALATAETLRRYWSRRETRNQAEFRAAVQRVVDESIADVIRRQTEFERRQGAHLDQQDKAMEQLRRAMERRPRR